MPAATFPAATMNVERGVAGAGLALWAIFLPATAGVA